VTGPWTLLRRIGVTVAGIALYRAGSTVPLPTIRREVLDNLDASPGDALWQQFVGTPLSSVSFFAIGVVPFVTAGLVLQLLRTVIPALRRLEESGETREQLRRTTRVVVIAIAGVQALVIVAGHRGARHGTTSAIADGLLAGAASAGCLLLGFALTGIIAGTISRHGTGAGVPVLLLANVLAATGARLATLLPELTKTMLLWGTFLLATGLLLAVVGMRSHHVLRVRPTRLDVAGETGPTEVRAHILQGGVLTLIFATTLLGVITGVLRPVLGLFGEADLLSVGTPLETAVFFLLVVLLARLQLRVTLDPVDFANSLARSKYFLEGVRPGWPTADRVAGMSNSAALALLLLLLPLTVATGLGGPLGGGITVLLPASTLILVTSFGIELLRSIRADSRPTPRTPVVVDVNAATSPWG
jgi:preprotein translocase subunit SecY